MVSLLDTLELVEHLTCEHRRLNELHKLVDLNQKLNSDLEIGTKTKMRLAHVDYVVDVQHTRCTVGSKHAHTLEQGDTTRRQRLHYDTMTGIVS